MYRRKTQGWVEYADFVLLEIICVNISYILAYCIRHGWSTLPYSNHDYLVMAGVISALDMLAIILFDPFTRILKRGPYREFLVSIRHVAVVFAGVALHLFLIQESATYSRLTIFLTFVFDFVIGYVLKLIFKRTRIVLKKHGRSMLLISDGTDIVNLIHSISNDADNGIKICGICLTEGAVTCHDIEGIPIVCDRNTLTEYVCREWVDEVFVRVVKLSEFEPILQAIGESGVTIHIGVGQNTNVLLRKQTVEKIGGNSVVTFSMNAASSVELFIKRVADILGGLIGSVFTLIIAIILAPFILIKSPGPLFFVQERIGQNGKRFKMIKFRSMVMDAEAKKEELKAENTMTSDLMFKMDFDPRIIGNKVLPDGTKKTGIGEFIRKTSIDEFPQFFNVLKGDMSLVGTRPPTLDEWNRYEVHHRARLNIRPGITGLWQVSGRSEITDFEEVVKLDTEYISKWSLGMDVKILMQTVGVVLKGRGAK